MQKFFQHFDVHLTSGNAHPSITCFHCSFIVRALTNTIGALCTRPNCVALPIADATRLTRIDNYDNNTGLLWCWDQSQHKSITCIAVTIHIDKTRKTKACTSRAIHIRQTVSVKNAWFTESTGSCKILNVIQSVGGHSQNYSYLEFQASVKDPMVVQHSVVQLRQIFFDACQPVHKNRLHRFCK